MHGFVFVGFPDASSPFASMSYNVFVDGASGFVPSGIPLSILHFVSVFPAVSVEHGTLQLKNSTVCCWPFSVIVVVEGAVVIAAALNPVNGCLTEVPNTNASAHFVGAFVAVIVEVNVVFAGGFLKISVSGTVHTTLGPVAVPAPPPPAAGALNVAVVDFAELIVKVQVVLVPVQSPVQVTVVPVPCGVAVRVTVVGGVPIG